MMMFKMYTRTLFTALFVTLMLLGGATEARAHCDKINGPVVTDAKKALATSELTPVLKWIVEEDEAEVRDAFRQTLAVREKGPEARELADRYFFETLVRLHRKSEGAPYTGLKPASADVGPAITAADRALEDSSVDALIALVTEDVARELRESYEQTRAAKLQADASVEQGRDFVKKYVHFIHLAKRIHEAATGSAGAHGAGTAEL